MILKLFKEGITILRKLLFKTCFLSAFQVTTKVVRFFDNYFHFILSNTFGIQSYNKNDFKGSRINPNVLLICLQALSILMPPSLIIEGPHLDKDLVANLTVHLNIEWLHQVFLSKNPKTA